VLGVTRRTIDRWTALGILRPIRIASTVRFHPDDVATLIRKGRDLEPIQPHLESEGVEHP